MEGRYAEGTVFYGGPGPGHTMNSRVTVILERGWGAITDLVDNG